MNGPTESVAQTGEYTEDYDGLLSQGWLFDEILSFLSPCFISFPIIGFLSVRPSFKDFNVFIRNDQFYFVERIKSRTLSPLS